MILFLNFILQSFCHAFNGRVDRAGNREREGNDMLETGHRLDEPRSFTLKEPHGARPRLLGHLCPVMSDSLIGNVIS